mmetsp:Transcript_5031/g.12688  ORF Transcript_5031/g.12688 Transcript_5031/m.12688 type:complete len:394 (+) Transcript_5031:116-1297(+)|eukprot:CAMPEP_0178992982 /NCGR_PEP_ID=MMETSP0795-20121207/6431_1 /TAXON_ID=88552 /ORGANISM="Amoebophrya sp., Strain Ameob2" /LENGTH=393 /DNA_ID=CAMNT_0020684953 /DNA_START=107 /DNA_END=1288 /DNA_ORIENTATION=+
MGRTLLHSAGQVDVDLILSRGLGVLREWFAAGFNGFSGGFVPTKLVNRASLPTSFEDHSATSADTAEGAAEPELDPPDPRPPDTGKKLDRAGNVVDEPDDAGNKDSSTAAGGTSGGAHSSGGNLVAKALSEAGEAASEAGYDAKEAVVQNVADPNSTHKPTPQSDNPLRGVAPYVGPGANPPGFAGPSHAEDTLPGSDPDANAHKEEADRGFEEAMAERNKADAAKNEVGQGGGADGEAAEEEREDANNDAKGAPNQESGDPAQEEMLQDEIDREGKPKKPDAPPTKEQNDALANGEIPPPNGEDPAKSKKSNPETGSDAAPAPAAESKAAEEASAEEMEAAKNASGAKEMQEPDTDSMDIGDFPEQGQPDIQESAVDNNIGEPPPKPKINSD